MRYRTRIYIDAHSDDRREVEGESFNDYNQLTLQNFGIYAGRQTVDLQPSLEKPVVLFGGLNGRRKTFSGCNPAGTFMQIRRVL